MDRSLIARRRTRLRLHPSSGGVSTGDGQPSPLARAEGVDPRGRRLRPFSGRPFSGRLLSGRLFSDASVTAHLSAGGAR